MYTSPGSSFQSAVKEMKESKKPLQVKTSDEGNVKLEEKSFVSRQVALSKENQGHL